MTDSKPRDRLKLSQVKKALAGANGNLTQAAKKLKKTRGCLYKWIKKHPALAEIRAEASEILLDVAEDKLRRAVNRGDPWAVRFTLARKGRSRGWGNTLDVHTESSQGVVVVTRGDPSEADIDKALDGRNVNFVIALPDNERERKRDHEKHEKVVKATEGHNVGLVVTLPNDGRDKPEVDE